MVTRRADNPGPFYICWFSFLCLIMRVTIKFWLTQDLFCFIGQLFGFQIVLGAKNCFLLNFRVENRSLGLYNCLLVPFIELFS